MTLDLDLIKTDGGTQPREVIDADTVGEYAEAIQTGVVLPPVIVFFDGAQYWLADGFHRFWAARKCDRTGIDAEIKDGSLDDAIWYALGSNTTHGLKRSNADKRKAILIALKKWGTLSDRAIAAHVNVHHETVGRMRAEARPVPLKTDPTGETASSPPAKRLGADGKWRPIIPPFRAPPRAPSPLPEGEGQGEGVPSPLFSSLPSVKSPSPLRASAPPRDPIPLPVDASASPLLDKVGQPIPPRLVPLWSRAGEVQDLLTALSRIKSAISSARETKDPLFSEVNFPTVEAELKTAYDHIKVAIPYALCPTCRGNLTATCAACAHKGFLSQFRWDRCVPQETKTLIAKSLQP